MELGGRPLFLSLMLIGATFQLVLAQIRHPLPVLWMMPVSPRSGTENMTASVVPAVELALQDLKEQPPPLGNYEIQLQLLDSQCDAPHGLKALFDAMWAGPKYLMLFGGVCRSVTTLIGQSLPALNLVQVSFAASAPSSNLFSAAPSDRVLNQASVKLLQKYRWTRVGILTQERPGPSEMQKDLLRQLVKAKIHVVSAESFSDDACSKMKKLKESDVRIFLGQFEEDSVSEVFCCAYRLNLFGSRYQWIISGGGAVGWRLGWQVSGCTANSLVTAADGSITLQIRPLSNTNQLGISGRTPQEYEEAYLRQLVREGSKVSPLHGFAYDAVWVAAKALSHVMDTEKQRKKYGIHRNMSVSEKDVTKRLLQALKHTRFEGVTGPVFFRNGERMTTIELIQFQGSGGVLVGDFNTSTQQLKLTNNLLKFKGSGPARDQTEVRLQHRSVSLLVYAVVSSAAAVIIFLTLSVICFSAVAYKHRGGFQDELLLLGLLLCSSSVLISGLDEASLSDWTFDLLCSVRLWMLSVGHTVTFAVLFTQTWRVYLLGLMNQKQQTGLHGSGCVLLWILLLDALVLTSWQILDPLRWVVMQHNAQSDDSDQDLIIQPFSKQCSSRNMELWVTAVCGYKGPLLGLGCFVAWSLRSGFSDDVLVSNKQLTFSMSALTLFSLSGLSVAMTTSHNPPLQFCLISSFILSCHLLLLVSLFSPKCLFMWSNRAELQAQVQPPLKVQHENADEFRLNQQLKTRTTQLDIEIETISMQLYEMSKLDQNRQLFTDDANYGLVQCEMRSGMWTHVVQVCAASRDSEKTPSSPESDPDDINSSECVHRRLSVQLPILHHSYLPIIGGVSSSSSDQFSSEDTFVPVTMTQTCRDDTAEPIRPHLRHKETVKKNERASVSVSVL